MTIEVRGRPIVVFNKDGEFFALLDRCPHFGAPLSKGTLVSLVESNEPGEFQRTRHGEILQCPWHGWEYDLRTGQSWCDPKSIQARAFSVTIEQGCGLAKGPFVAETFPVAVEDQYIVIDV